MKDKWKRHSSRFSYSSIYQVSVSPLLARAERSRRVYISTPMFRRTAPSSITRDYNYERRENIQSIEYDRIWRLVAVVLEFK